MYDQVVFDNIFLMINSKQQNLSFRKPQITSNNREQTDVNDNNTTYYKYNTRKRKNIRSNNLRFKTINPQNKRRFFIVQQIDQNTIDQMQKIRQSKINKVQKLPLIDVNLSPSIKKNLSQYRSLSNKGSYQTPTVNSILNSKEKIKKIANIKHNLSQKRICSVNCFEKPIKNLHKNTKSRQKQISNNANELSIRKYLQSQRQARYPNTQLKKYLFKMNEQIKIDNLQKDTQNRVNYELMQSFYELQTQFVKQMEQIKHIQNRHHILQNLSSNRIKLPSIPFKQDLVQFIQYYLPFNKQIKLEILMTSTHFEVEHTPSHLFFGQIINNQRQGIGILIEHAKCFEGSFKANKKQSGMELGQSGIYKGSFYNQKREGKGQFQWFNGEYYIGDWKNGMRDGVGVWTNRHGDSYNGDWDKDKCTGHAIFIANGQQYIGNFVDFVKQGWGQQQFLNGDRYEGYFKNGHPHGKGRYIWSNGTQYQGQFLFGFRSGEGILQAKYGLVYKGQFIDQRPEGRCKIYLPNGDLYSGHLKNGKKNGRGIFTLSNKNQIIEGYWQNDNFIDSFSCCGYQSIIDQFNQFLD